MKKATLLKIVNVALFVFAVNQAVTGFLRGRINSNVYDLLHGKAAFVLVALALVHLILNWNWVKSALLKRRPRTKPE